LALTTATTVVPATIESDLIHEDIPSSPHAAPPGVMRERAMIGAPVRFRAAKMQIPSDDLAIPLRLSKIILPMR
jgi:hypothetical protein